MKSTYYDYLKSLPSEKLIEMVYKPFDYRGSCPMVSKRKIALRISYDGSEYHGVQRHKFLKSVGDCLQNALELSKLGPYEDSDGKTQIVFCGRTDAGVSAVSMVASLVVSSHLKDPNHSFEPRDDDFDEYPYDVILNQLLPRDIRVTGWAPAAEAFNARYDCVQRHYRYYFILNGMDLSRMVEAMNRILKMDDFYSLSKHSNPRAVYQRKVDEMKMYRADEHGNLADVGQEVPEFAGSGDINSESARHCPGQPGFQHVSKIANNKYKQERLKQRSKCCGDLYCLDIKACGFLHNMVRKIFWVIRSCGESNSFSLASVELADAHPLVFVDAQFKHKLNFMSNRYNEPQFRQEEEHARISHAISRLRLDMHNQSII